MFKVSPPLWANYRIVEDTRSVYPSTKFTICKAYYLDAACENLHGVVVNAVNINASTKAHLFIRIDEILDAFERTILVDPPYLKMEELP